jgi:HEAT repeat protein
MIVFCTMCWAQNPPEATECLKCGATLEALQGNYVEKLILALRHPLPETAQLAAWILGELKAPDAAPRLKELLSESEEPGTLEAAAEALGKIGDASAIGALASGCSRWPLRTRVKVAEALGSIGGPEADEALSAMLHDPSSTVRAAAQRALDALKIRVSRDER